MAPDAFDPKSTRSCLGPEMAPVAWLRDAGRTAVARGRIARALQALERTTEEEGKARAVRVEEIVQQRHAELERHLGVD